MKYVLIFLFAILLDTNSFCQNLIIDLNDGAEFGVVSDDANQLYYKLYFNGSNSDFVKPSLFSCDGTTAGTIEVIGSEHITNLSNITTTKSKLFMRAQDGLDLGLYTKGDTGALQFVKKFNGPFIQSMFPYYDSKVVMFIKTQLSLTLPDELWVSDGTESGTTKLISLNTTSNNNYVSSVFKGQFTFYDRSVSTNKVAPQITDGTTLGTQTVLNYMKSNGLYNMTTVASVLGIDSLLFVSGAASGNKCIVTDGTVAGTKVIPMKYTDSYLKIIPFKDQLLICTSKEIVLYNYSNNQAASLNSSVYFYSDFLLYKDKVYFYSDNLGDKAIYQTDGTKTGTIKLDNSPFGAPTRTKLLGLGHFIYFLSETNGQSEIWYSNIDTLRASKLDDFGSQNSPHIFEVLNNAIVFSKYTPALGSELYSYGNFSVDTKPVCSSLLNEMSIYPGQSKGIYILHSDLLSEPFCKMEIIGLDGRIILEKSLGKGESNNLVFQMPENKPSIYLFKLYYGNKFKVKKFYTN